MPLRVSPPCSPSSAGSDEFSRSVWQVSGSKTSNVWVFTYKFALQPAMGVETRLDLRIASCVSLLIPAFGRLRSFRANAMLLDASMCG